MSLDHASWSLTPSTLIPMILQLRAANSSWRPATAPSSVVHTGVKSLGCENRTAQPSPIHSWKWIVPCVVSAVKSGAVSLIRRVICPPFGLRLRALARSCEGPAMESNVRTPNPWCRLEDPERPGSGKR